MDGESVDVWPAATGEGVRVLHLAAGRAYGGVETVLRTFHEQRVHAPALEQSFAFVYEGQIAEELRARRALVSVIGPARAARPWSVLRAFRELEQLVERITPDVVVCHGAWMQAVFGWGVRALGLPLAVWAHTVPRKRSWEERVARRVRPDLVLYNSRYTQSGCERDYEGVEARVLYPVLPASSPLPGSVRARLRAELGAGPEEVVIVLAARFDPSKGQRLLIEALAKLRATGWVAWIVGEAQGSAQLAYRKEVEALVAALGLGARVRFTGARSDVRELLASADVYCQPNVLPEPFGLAYVEALDAGLPVVATRMGGALEILNQTCSELVANDAGHVADALARLITSPERRRRLGNAARLRAAEFCRPAERMRELEQALRRFRRPRPAGPGAARGGLAPSSFSVLVPSFARPLHLQRCLQALAAQSLPPCEIVVGTRADDVETAALLERITPVLGVKVRRVTTTATGVVASMNTALAACRGDLIALTDDDAEPLPDWLERLALCFRDPRVGGAGGKDLQVLETGSRRKVGLVQWFGRLIGQHHVGGGPPRRVDWLKGVNVAFRAELLRERGFDRRVAGSGVQLLWELGICLPLRRTGWFLIYDPAIAVRHHVAPRHESDPDRLHRGTFSFAPHSDVVHNETLALLEHQSGVGRVASWAFWLLIGTSGEPGLAQLPRLFARHEPNVRERWLATLDGRRRGFAHFLALAREEPRAERA